MCVTRPKSRVWRKWKIARPPSPSRLKTFPWETSATAMRPTLTTSPWRWVQCVLCAGASEINPTVQAVHVRLNVSVMSSWRFSCAWSLGNGRQMTVTSGNQLVECQECHNLYHQECHKPQVTDKDVNDPRLVWYCARCTRQMKRMVSTSAAFTLRSHR